MCSFREYRGKWWWFVEGKGAKKAKVPVTDEMLDALMRYRQFLGLDALPSVDDDSPIVRSLKGTRPVSANMIYRMVKGSAHETEKIVR
jgi:site-specific recombinase XerC